MAYDDAWWDEDEAPGAGPAVGVPPELRLRLAARKYGMDFDQLRAALHAGGGVLSKPPAAPGGLGSLAAAPGVKPPAAVEFKASAAPGLKADAPLKFGISTQPDFEVPDASGGSPAPRSAGLPIAGNKPEPPRLALFTGVPRVPVQQVFGVPRAGAPAYGWAGAPVWEQARQAAGLNPRVTFPAGTPGWLPGGLPGLSTPARDLKASDALVARPGVPLASSSPAAPAADGLPGMTAKSAPPLEAGDSRSGTAAGVPPSGDLTTAAGGRTPVRIPMVRPFNGAPAPVSVPKAWKELPETQKALQATFAWTQQAQANLQAEHAALAAARDRLGSQTTAAERAAYDAAWSALDAKQHQYQQIWRQAEEVAARAQGLRTTPPTGWKPPVIPKIAPFGGVPRVPAAAAVRAEGEDPALAGVQTWLQGASQTLKQEEAQLLAARERLEVFCTEALRGEWKRAQAQLKAKVDTYNATSRQFGRTARAVWEREQNSPLGQGLAKLYQERQDLLNVQVAAARQGQALPVELRDRLGEVNQTLDGVAVLRQFMRARKLGQQDLNLGPNGIPLEQQPFKVDARNLKAQFNQYLRDLRSKAQQNPQGILPEIGVRAGNLLEGFLPFVSGALDLQGQAQAKRERDAYAGSQLTPVPFPTRTRKGAVSQEARDEALSLVNRLGGPQRVFADRSFVEYVHWDQLSPGAQSALRQWIDDAEAVRRRQGPEIDRALQAYGKFFRADRVYEKGDIDRATRSPDFQSARQALSPVAQRWLDSYVVQLRTKHNAGDTTDLALVEGGLGDFFFNKLLRGAHKWAGKSVEAVVRRRLPALAAEVFGPAEKAGAEAVAGGTVRQGVKAALQRGGVRFATGALTGGTGMALYHIGNKVAQGRAAELRTVEGLQDLGREFGAGSLAFGLGNALLTPALDRLPGAAEELAAKRLTQGGAAPETVAKFAAGAHDLAEGLQHQLHSKAPFVALGPVGMAFQQHDQLYTPEEFAQAAGSGALDAALLGAHEGATEAGGALAGRLRRAGKGAVDWGRPFAQDVWDARGNPARTRAFRELRQADVGELFPPPEAHVQRQPRDFHLPEFGPGAPPRAGNRTPGFLAPEPERFPTASREPGRDVRARFSPEAGRRAAVDPATGKPVLEGPPLPREIPGREEPAPGDVVRVLAKPNLGPLRVVGIEGDRAVVRHPQTQERLRIPVDQVEVQARGGAPEPEATPFGLGPEGRFGPEEPPLGAPQYGGKPPAAALEPPGKRVARSEAWERENPLREAPVHIEPEAGDVVQVTAKPQWGPLRVQGTEGDRVVVAHPQTQERLRIPRDQVEVQARGERGEAAPERYRPERENPLREIPPPATAEPPTVGELPIAGEHSVARRAASPAERSPQRFALPPEPPPGESAPPPTTHTEPTTASEQSGAVAASGERPRLTERERAYLARTLAEHVPEGGALYHAVPPEHVGGLVRKLESGVPQKFDLRATADAAAPGRRRGLGREGGVVVKLDPTRLGGAPVVTPGAPAESGRRYRVEKALPEAATALVVRNAADVPRLARDPALARAFDFDAAEATAAGVRIARRAVGGQAGSLNAAEPPVGPKTEPRGGRAASVPSSEATAAVDAPEAPETLSTTEWLERAYRTLPFEHLVELFGQEAAEEFLAGGKLPRLLVRGPGGNAPRKELLSEAAALQQFEGVLRKQSAEIQDLLLTPEGGRAFRAGMPLSEWWPLGQPAEVLARNPDGTPESRVNPSPETLQNPHPHRFRPEQRQAMFDEARRKVYAAYAKYGPKLKGAEFEWVDKEKGWARFAGFDVHDVHSMEHMTEAELRSMAIKGYALKVPAAPEDGLPSEPLELHHWEQGFPYSEKRYSLHKRQGGFNDQHPFGKAAEMGLPNDLREFHNYVFRGEYWRARARQALREKGLDPDAPRHD